MFACWQEHTGLGEARGVMAGEGEGVDVIVGELKRLDCGEGEGATCWMAGDGSG